MTQQISDPANQELMTSTPTRYNISFHHIKLFCTLRIRCNTSHTFLRDSTSSNEMQYTLQIYRDEADFVKRLIPAHRRSGLSVFPVNSRASGR
jgi:hypothetical protein